MTSKFELDEALRQKMFAEAIATRKIAMAQVATIANMCLLLHAREIAAAVAAALGPDCPAAGYRLGAAVQRRANHVGKRNAGAMRI